VWAPDEKVSRLILVDNPAVLYDYRRAREGLIPIRQVADLAHAFFGIRPWKRNSIFSVAVICILCGLAGCSAAPLVEPYDGSASRTEVIYVISGDWHTQLGLPLGAINGPLAAMKAEFPSAGYLVFGWGARDYYMARDPGIGDILRAVTMIVALVPLPPWGPAVKRRLLRKQNRTEFAPPGSSRRSGRTRLAAGAESMTEIPRCRTVRF
jgi:Protein of unknown function (DUF2459)